jgi:hypothetical protein
VRIRVQVSMALVSFLLVGCAGPTSRAIVARAPLFPVCPSSLTDAHSGSRLSQLVPNMPDRAVWCQYASMNEKVKPGALVRFVAVRNPSALAKLLNQAKPVPKNAAYSCPADLGGRDAIVFAKAGKKTVISLGSGCLQTTSTNTSGTWFLSAAAISALQKLASAVTGHSAEMVSLHGELIQVGGPAGAANLPRPGQVAFTSDKNTVLVSVPNSGQFEVFLLPGTYTVSGSSPLIDEGNRVCAPDRPVVVKIGTRAPRVEVVCSIP